MRSLATLATLLLGLAVVFWAPAAKAHCPDHAHCEEDPPELAVGFGTLLDAYGITIGQVVGISATGVEGGPTVSIFFEVSGHLLLADVMSVSEVERKGFRKTTQVYFSETGCVGLTWVKPGDGIRADFFGEFSSALITGNSDTPNVRRLFHILPGTSITTDVETPSAIGPGYSGCQNNGPVVQDMFSVTELDSDLHTTFPRPYSVDFTPIQ